LLPNLLSNGQHAAIQCMSNQCRYMHVCEPDDASVSDAYLLSLEPDMFTLLAVSATKDQQRQVGNPVRESRSGLRNSMHGTLSWYWDRGTGGAIVLERVCVCVCVKMLCSPALATGYETVQACRFQAQSRAPVLLPAPALRTAITDYIAVHALTAWLCAPHGRWQRTTLSVRSSQPLVGLTELTTGLTFHTHIMCAPLRRVVRHLAVYAAHGLLHSRGQRTGCDSCTCLAFPQL
jgi:hypothetical protein